MRFGKNSPTNFRLAKFSIRGGTLIAVLVPAVGEAGAFERIIGIGHESVVMGDTFIWVHPEYRLTNR